MLTFKGHIAILTGGTGDLGQAMLRRLCAEGLKVAFTYHTRRDLAEELVRECSPECTLALPVQTSRLEEARALVKTVQAQWGPIDYLINNAGAPRDRAFVQMEESDWQEALDVNLTSAFAFTRALMFDLMKRPGSAVVNISAVAALTGSAGQANYAAAKAGLHGFTRSLAREYGRLGVRINAIAPGYIESRLTGRLPEPVKAKALELIPMRRFGRPEEVASAAAFLLSEQAAYIQGQILTVDGGLAM